jgi:hypothetical protein
MMRCGYLYGDSPAVGGNISLYYSSMANKNIAVNEERCKELITRCLVLSTTTRDDPLVGAPLSY